MCACGDSTCGIPDGEAMPAPEGRAPSTAEQLERLRSGIAGALGLSPVPDASLVETVARVCARHGAAEAEASLLDTRLMASEARERELRDQLAKLEADLARVDRDLTAMMDAPPAKMVARGKPSVVEVVGATLRGLAERCEIAERAQNEAEHRACRMDREIVTLRASLEEARAAEQRERERADKAERLAAERRVLETIGTTSVEVEALRERAARAERAERLLDVSRRDADALRQELSEIKLCAAQAEELRRRVAALEADVADAARARVSLRGKILELERAAARHAEAQDQLREAQRHADQLVGRVAELERELEALQADRRWTAADALRDRLRRVEALSATRLRRWEAATAEVESLREQLARMKHVCDVWKPAPSGKPSDPWICETCGKPFENAVFDPPANPATPSELQCNGSDGPLGELNGEGRFPCRFCDFSVAVGPAPLARMPPHPPRRGGGR